jgi:hypothetical protein
MLNAFFIAMAHWQLGEHGEARKWYDRAVEWMEKYEPEDEELRRFRAEAEDLLKEQSGVRHLLCGPITPSSFAG